MLWDRYGRSALAAAAQAEQLDVLKLLSAEGADVDTENKQGLTPLMVAVRDEKAKVVVSPKAHVPLAVANYNPLSKHVQCP